MNTRLTTRGFSLVGLLLGGLVVAGLLVLAARTLRLFNASAQKAEQQASSAEQLEIVSRALTRIFGGSHSYQNLSLKIPSSGQICGGLGFCVLNDTDVNGNALAGAQTLVTLEKVPMEVGIQLASNASNTQLSLQTSDGTTALSDLLSTGDYIVVSNMKSSDLIKITDTVPTAATFTQSLSASNFDMRGGTHSLNRYLSGDPVYKTALVRIGIDPATQSLRMLVNSQSRQLAPRISSFSVEYTVRDIPNLCASVPASAQFSGNWTALDADSSCYQKVDQFRIRYSIVVNAETGETKGSENVFQSSI